VLLHSGARYRRFLAVWINIFGGACVLSQNIGLVFVKWIRSGLEKSIAFSFSVGKGKELPNSTSAFLFIENILFFLCPGDHYVRINVMGLFYLVSWVSGCICSTVSVAHSCCMRPARVSAGTVSLTTVARRFPAAALTIRTSTSKERSVS
jgi:hypothetical protein